MVKEFGLTQFMCKPRHWKRNSAKKFKVRCSFVGNRVPTSEIRGQLVQVYSDAVTRVQHDRKGCRCFENGRPNIHDDDDDDCTVRPSTSLTGVNATRVEELIFKRVYHSDRHHFHSNKERKWLFDNGCELNIPISTAMKLLNSYVGGTTTSICPGIMLKNDDNCTD